MEAQHRVSSKILAALALCIALNVLWSSKVEARNPKPSLCNTFGGCGLGRAMWQPNGISTKGQADKNGKVATLLEAEGSNEEDYDTTRYLEEEDDEITEALASLPGKELALCTGKKPEPILPCSLDASGKLSLSRSNL